MRRLLLTATSLLLSIGCDANLSLAASKETSMQALRGGAPLAAGDGLGDLAVGRVVDAAGRLRCTALALDARRLVTASHCVQPGNDVAAVVDAHTLAFVERNRDDVLPIVDVTRHPTLDVAVLALGQAVVGSGVDVAATPAAVGEHVTTLGAGLGTPATDIVHAGAFVVDVVDDDALVLRPADDATGLCPGDSGGPVLGLRDGAWALLGVHVRGFDDCAAPSTSVRADVVADFFTEARSLPVDDAIACDGAVDDDVCEGDMWRRCVLGFWRAVPCAEVSHRCVDDDEGARCAPVPCGDVSAAGRCDGSVAVACIGGTRVQRDCAREEGLGCALDPSTGRRGCVACDACDGICVDHAVDPAHCGACAIACAAQQDCVRGVCVDDAVDAGDEGEDEAEGEGEDDDQNPPPHDDGAHDGAGCAGAGGGWAILCLPIARPRRRR